MSMPEFSSFGRLLIVGGLLLVVIGLIITFAGRIPGLGRLPGDILIQRGNFTFYAPIATLLLVSVVINLFLWLIRR